jgi:hypothetical protein
MGSVNYYGLEKEKYKELFLAKTRETADLMQSMDTELAKFGINSRELTSEVLWNIFESIASSTDEDARTYLMANDPDALNKREGIFNYTSNREIKQELEALTGTVTTLSERIAELVPPPAETDAYDDVALESEYCPTCENSTGACELH